MKLAAAVLAALFATQAAAQDASMTWSVETPKEGDAALRYSVPDTDMQPLAFTCARKSGQVQTFAQLQRKIGVRRVSGDVWVDQAGVRGPWPMSVVLASETASATLRGKVQYDEATDGSLATAEFSTQAPMAESFRKSGLISLTAAGETVQPPPAPKSMVRKFLGACK